MRVGILGTGDVGRSLGKGFLTLGHEVKLGARIAGNDKATLFANEMGPKASAGTFSEAAKFGEIVVLATLGIAAETALTLAGTDLFRNKVVLDTTNPLDFGQGFPPKLAIGTIDSGGERIQRRIPGANVVKVFNTVGHAHMFRPVFPGGPPDMFLCGNDDGAKKQVVGLLREFGWNGVDLGNIEASRYLEPMSLIWVLYGIHNNTWNHAFKVLTR